MKIFSGIQPTNVIHIGNYLGALKNWVEIQDEADKSIFCIVDLHAITVPQDPEKLQKSILNTAALYLACGVDPEKSTIFVQSDRPEHTELAWMLNCHTNVGELVRMTQFAEKSNSKDLRSYLEKIKKEEDESDKKFKTQADRFINLFRNTYDANQLNIISEEAEIFLKIAKSNVEIKKILYDVARKSLLYDNSSSVGLFDYPALMAADILIYNATHVPVGEDQKQHIELTRDLAQRINNKYEEVFTVPEPLIKKHGARIMALDDPTSKMSKSAESKYSYIALTDSDDEIREKVKKAVTDSGDEIRSGEDKPAMTNLLTIFSGFSGESIEDLEKRYKDKQYSEFKNDLADILVDKISPIRKKYEELIEDEKKLKEILSSGAESLKDEAQETIKKVKDKMGLGISDV